MTATRQASLAEQLLGIQGLALLRGLVSGSNDDAAARMDDIRRLAADGEDARLATRIAFPERSVDAGYADWSETYDRPDNPLIHLEESVLLPLLEALPAGRALDAACGTGRVSARLDAAGHELLGVDASAEMLAVARANVPQYRDRDGAWAFVRGYPHLHGDFLRAFGACGLRVEELLEPTPDRRWFELQRIAWSEAPDAFRQAFEGIPAAIVWSLRKR